MVSDRGRSFLTEYASRNRHPDTRKFVDTIARLDAAMRDEPRPQMPAALAEGLADLATTIEQIEAALGTSGTSAPDVHFAVERIQDIAMALRQREVEAALCDTLEAAIREVGDAVVRNDAAAARATSAAGLLRDLARRVSEMNALVPTAAADAVERPADIETRRDDSAERFDDTDAQMSATDSADARVADGDIGSLLQSVPVPLPETQAPAGPERDPENLFEPVPLPIPSPLDGNEEAAHASERENEAAHVSDHENEAACVHHREGEAASELLSAETSASASAASAPTVGTPPSETPSPQPHADVNATPPAIPRAVLDDPLAQLRALSEEELIALFS